MTRIEEIEADAGMIDLSFDTRAVSKLDEAEVKEVLHGLSEYKLGRFERDSEDDPMRLESLGASWHLDEEGKLLLVASSWWVSKGANAPKSVQSWTLTLTWDKERKSLLVEASSFSKLARFIPLYVDGDAAVVGSNTFEVIGNEGFVVEGETFADAVELAFIRIEELSPKRMEECRNEMEAHTKSLTTSRMN